MPRYVMFFGFFFPIHSILHFMLGEGFLGFNIQYIEVLQIKQFDSFYQMVEEKKERIQEEVKRL